MMEGDTRTTPPPPRAGASVTMAEALAAAAPSPSPVAHPPPSPASCSCLQCAGWRRQLRALSAMAAAVPGMEAAASVVERGLAEHAAAVAQPWVCAPATFHDAFFPTPFSRFLYSGALPPLADIARGLGVPPLPLPLPLLHAATLPRQVAAWATLLWELLAEPAHARDTACVPAAWAPVFVVGCGRSGTTLLARMLRCHPAVVDINEARAVWLACSPRLDVWSGAAAADALLRVGADTLPPATLARMRRLAYAALLMSPPVAAAVAAACASAEDAVGCVHAVAGQFVLVEKLPENAFRTPMLAAAFPGARFLHIVRHREAVAASIAKFSPPAWYGMADVKWRALVGAALPVPAAAAAAAAGPADSAIDCSVAPPLAEADMRVRGRWERDLAVATVRADAVAAGRRIVRLPASPSESAAAATTDTLLEVHFEEVVLRPREVWASLHAALALPCRRDAATDDAAATEAALGAFIGRLRPDRAAAAAAPPAS